MFFQTPIAPSLSPNSSWRDAWISLSYILLPWKWNQWKQGPFQGIITKEVEAYFPHHQATFFDSGRSALYAVCKALGIGPGDEVILQAFTCIVVPNAIFWAGATPVYIDIKRETFNMDEMELEKKITPRTKAILVQHTFGKPANMAVICEIAKKHSIPIIEDCAHALGATFQGQKVGTFGAAAIFSLGRDKIISAVSGGFALTSTPSLTEKMRQMEKEAPTLSSKRIFQHLMHPLLFQFVLPLYSVLGIGKILLHLAQKFGLVSKVFQKAEKQGIAPSPIISRFPNALAELAFFQWKKLELFEKHRRCIARRYQDYFKNQPEVILPKEEDPEYHLFFRYSILLKNRNSLLLEGKKAGILFGDWYDTPIAPKDSRPEAVNYTAGSCPRAEAISTEVVNLPTHPRLNESQLQRVFTFFQNFFHHS